MKMSRKLFVCIGLSLLTLVCLAQSAQAQGYWWKNERFLKQLALSADQSARIESLYQAAQPTLRAQKRALDKLDDELSTMIHDPKVGEAELEQFVKRVEAAKADVSTSRTMLLVRIGRVLTAEQSAKLHRLYEQDEKERRGRHQGPGPGKKQQ
jgi:Spy/CpxP family protein refolding chaperone